MKGQRQIDKWQEEEEAGVHSSCFWYRDAASVSGGQDHEWQQLAEAMRVEMVAIEKGTRSKMKSEV